jgi:hypothetical protein
MQITFQYIVRTNIEVVFKNVRLVPFNLPMVDGLFWHGDRNVQCESCCKLGGILRRENRIINTESVLFILVKRICL